MLLTECKLDGIAFILVAKRRGCSVRIEVVHFVGAHRRIAKCGLHAAHWPVLHRRSDVMRICAHAKTCQFSIDPGPALLCRLEGLEHHHARSFAKHETIALAIPGSRSFRGIVVALRKRTRCAKPTEPKRRNRGLCAASNHDLRVAVSNHPRCKPDAVQTGCAGRHDGQVRAFEAEHDRELSRNHVDDRSRNKKRRDAPHAARCVLSVGVLDQGKAPDPRTHQTAHMLRIEVLLLQPRIPPSLQRRSNPIVDEHIEMSRFLRRHPKRHIKIPDFPSDSDRESACVEAGDRPDPRTTRDHIGPGLLHRVANRADDPQPGDRDATARH